jgi:hypothetical protein
MIRGSELPRRFPVRVEITTLTVINEYRHVGELFQNGFFQKETQIGFV